MAEKPLPINKVGALENTSLPTRIAIVIGATTYAIFVVTFKTLFRAAASNNGFWIFMSTLAVLLFLSR